MKILDHICQCHHKEKKVEQMNICCKYLDIKDVVVPEQGTRSWYLRPSCQDATFQNKLEFCDGEDEDENPTNVLLAMLKMKMKMKMRIHLTCCSPGTKVSDPGMITFVQSELAACI